MKLNQKFIKQLRNGEIDVENSGTLEQLMEVLKAAFPEHNRTPVGDSRYYSRTTSNSDKWMASPFPHKDKPTFKISDFYQPDLFTGWAKDDNYPKWMGYFKNDMAKFGFDVFGSWFGLGEYKGVVSYSRFLNNRPATHEEIEKALVKEAKRRGYKGGETIKGLYSTTHWSYEISSFYYDQRWDRLLTNEGCIVYEKGQWAEIVEKPQAKPIHYLVDDMKYSFNYQELKERYEDVTKLTDKEFMNNLPEIAHLACVVSFFKGLGSNATIGDKGIIHELLHLMTEPNEPTNDLQEIREKFNKLIQLV